MTNFSRQCFSCQQFGHHGQDCPHEKTTLLIEEALYEEDIGDKIVGCIMLEIGQFLKVQVLLIVLLQITVLDTLFSLIDEIWGKHQQSQGEWYIRFLIGPTTEPGIISDNDPLPMLIFRPQFWYLPFFGFLEVWGLLERGSQSS